MARLTPEGANLDAMLRRGLGGHNPVRWINATLMLAQYARFSVRPEPYPLDLAREVARTLQKTWHEAQCVERFGDLALRRSKNSEAQGHYEEAFSLYRQVKDLPGEANCMQSLGDLALRRSEYDAADRSYQVALIHYRRLGDMHGEANCIPRRRVFPQPVSPPPSRRSAVAVRCRAAPTRCRALVAPSRQWAALARATCQPASDPRSRPRHRGHAHSPPQGWSDRGHHLQAGRVPAIRSRKPEVFDDLAEVHRAPGVKDEAPAEAPAPA